MWLGLLSGYQWYARQNDLAPLQAVQRLTALMATGAYGPLIYVVLYALHSLILFPAGPLTVAAGFVFGPALGIFFTVLGSNISARAPHLTLRIRPLWREGICSASFACRVSGARQRREAELVVAA